MRIALLDPPGFTPPYDHALASALARRGHDVHLLTARTPRWPARPAEGYRRHDVFLPLSGRLLRRAPSSRARVALKGLEYVPSARRAVRLLEQLAPDLVHVQWLGIASYDARWLARVAVSRPLVVTAHDLEPRRRWNARGWAATLRLAERVLVHSDRALEHHAASLPRERLVLVPHAVFDAPPSYEPSEPTGETILLFGLLRRYKGLDVLLRALPAVAKAVPGVRLVVAGEPVDPVEPLRALASKLGVDERVEWRMGFLPDAQVAPLFERAAVVALPYRALESSGVLATALGLGRPAVVSDVGSLGTIVREFGAGRVVRPGDPAALAAACVELLTDRDALARAAAGARAARATLTWDAAAERHERLYEAVVAERR